VRGTARDPGEGVEKIKEKLSADYERMCYGALAPPPNTYRGDLDWQRGLHELCGAPWPCPLTHEFDQVWSGVQQTMAEHGLRVGRRNYGEDDDGDRALVGAAWCLTRHLRAQAVVETGVGHGVTSRALLEALAANGGTANGGAANGGGHLWSIDQSPMTISARNAEIGVAVTDDLREGWSYVAGSSRRRLPGLLSRLGKIDLFVHDSLHSTRNVLFECERALASLRPGGFIVVDDLDGNRGFQRFCARHPELRPLIGIAQDNERFFGLVQAPVEPWV
jgi:hypothetical protein